VNRALRLPDWRLSTTITGTRQARYPAQFVSKENVMTSAEESPGTDTSSGGGEEDIPEGGAGIGVTTTDEPDTFEPEESPE
jgi:hypothetical protein